MIPTDTESPPALLRPVVPASSEDTGTGWVRRALPVLCLVLAAAVPFCTVPVPIVLGGPVNSAGSLQLLAGCLVFAGIAIGYDLMFGRVGLMSFGHALYVSVGAYGAELAMSRLQLGLLPATLLAVLAATVLAALLGAVSLRARSLGGIGFAMVTLAFAQAGSVVVTSDPGGVTGGEEGLALPANHVPAMLTGVANTATLYWLALGYLVVCAGIVWFACGRGIGRTWQAVRDNPQRVTVLGANPRGYQLAALVLAGFLGALGGVAELLVSGGASPQLTTPDFTLSLLVMVVIGGSGSRWGPILGGLLYTLLSQRLTALGSASAIAGLPAILRDPLSQPLIVLGVVFILTVFLLPGGLTALPRRLLRRSRSAST